MCKSTLILKNMTIYFLIFAFALISFFGTNIRTTKAATTPDSTLPCSAGLQLYKVNGGEYESTNTDQSPVQVSFSASARNTGNNNFSVTAAAKYQTSTTNRWNWNVRDISELTPQNITIAKNNSIATQDIIIAQGASATYGALIDICWIGSDKIKRATSIKTSAVQITNNTTPSNPTANTTQTNTGEVSIGGGETTGETCQQKCPKRTWMWKVDQNIQNALCNTQCAIINMEASVIGWVIQKVLYPALGLCTEDDCPKLPETNAP